MTDWGISAETMSSAAALLICARVRIDDVTTTAAEHTSTRLYTLAYGSDSPRMTLGEIDAGLGSRALGLSMLVFALPCCFPMPPGIPAACGAAISAISLHLILGREQLWLPRSVAQRCIARADLRRLIERVLPTFRRIERVCRPRLAWATGRPSRAVLGVVALILGILLILPIPFLGNLPPGIAAAVIGFGLAERDGLVVGLGLLASGAAIAITSTMAWAAIEGLRHIF